MPTPGNFFPPFPPSGNDSIHSRPNTKRSAKNNLCYTHPESCSSSSSSGCCSSQFNFLEHKPLRMENPANWTAQTHMLIPSLSTCPVYVCEVFRLVPPRLFFLFIVKRTCLSDQFESCSFSTPPPQTLKLSVAIVSPPPHPTPPRLRCGAPFFGEKPILRYIRRS